MTQKVKHLKFDRVIEYIEENGCSIITLPFCLYLMRTGTANCSEIIAPMFSSNKGIYKDLLKFRGLSTVPAQRNGNSVPSIHFDPKKSPAPRNGNSVPSIHFDPKKSPAPRNGYHPTIIQDLSTGIDEAYYRGDITAIIQEKMRYHDINGESTLSITKVAENRFIQSVNRKSEAVKKIALFNGSKSFLLGHSYDRTPLSKRPELNQFWLEGWESSKELFAS